MNRKTVNTDVAAILLLIVILIASGAFGVFATLTEHGELVVDFDDIISANRALEDSRPTLRVAVAAMLSPVTTKRYYSDLLSLIGDRLGYRTVFLQRRTYEEVNRLLQRKELDLAFVCSGPYVTGHDEFGLELLVVPVVHGKKVYRSYLLANINSSIKSLEDLRGKRFAFTDPHSNTACFVPRFMLAQKGETPESFFGEMFFTYSHDNSIKAVAEGLADGAAVDSIIWEFINTIAPKYTAKTRIIEKSPPFGISPVVVRPQLNENMKHRLRELFLSLHTDDRAASLLRKLQIDRFEQGDDMMYESVRKMQHLVAQKQEQEE